MLKQIMDSFLTTGKGEDDGRRAIVQTKNEESANQAAPIVGTTIEVDDDSSSSSDNTASSTSGCSSLIPSHQDNLQRLHIPAGSLDRLRQQLKETVGPCLQSSTLTNTTSRTSNSSGLWSSKREFDVSKFIAPSSSIPFPPRSMTSPFYPGATKYGGASTRRAYVLTSGPYHLSQRKMAPITRVKASGASSQNLVPEDKMSSAARKILESMERISSFQEVKKLPPTKKVQPFNYIQDWRLPTPVVRSHKELSLIDFAFKFPSPVVRSREEHSLPDFPFKFSIPRTYQHSVEDKAQ